MDYPLVVKQCADETLRHEAMATFNRGASQEEKNAATRRCLAHSSVVAKHDMTKIRRRKFARYGPQNGE